MGSGDETAKNAPKSYMKSVCLLSAGFFGVFMAFNTAQVQHRSLLGSASDRCSQALETTVVTNTNLSHISLATLYALFAVGSVAAPWIVGKIGPRVSMIAGGIPYVLLVLSNVGTASYALSIPAFALVGLGASLLWSAEGVSRDTCTRRYAC